MTSGPWPRLRSKARDLFLGSAHRWILVVGIALRVRHLAENRSLWLDESYVAVNITSRSYVEILSGHEILPEFARQPMVFSLVEKFFVALFGNNELALRAFPFLSGIGALFLFAAVARKMLGERAYLIGLALFALSEPLVYYSAELKQYSTDLLCAIILIEAARIFLKNAFRPGHCLVLAFSGAFSLWLSNAMVFVLAGIGVVILLNRPWVKGVRTTALLCATAFIWLMSFFWLYYLSLRFMVGKTSITDTWQGAFCTSPIFSVETLRWSWNVLISSFSNPVGLKWWWFILPCFFAGVRVLWRENRNNTLLWLLPIGFTFLAALFGKYPFDGRVLLFLTAGYYLFIARGIDAILASRPVLTRKWAGCRLPH